LHTKKDAKNATLALIPSVDALMITCTFEDGGKASLRHAIIDALVLKENKILLVKRSKKLSKEPGKWAVVGGFVNHDENLLQTSEREIREETGYNVKDITFLYVMHSPDSPGDDRQNIKFVFFATALDKQGEHDWEESEIKWFDLDKLPEPLAFDHREHIKLYQRFLRKEITIPFLQS
jgi:ADP-ribose pyrophosphatase YjhB (NUDIX family)